MNLDPSRSAVLALHFQRDVIEADRPFGAIFNPMVAEGNVLQNTQQVLATARENAVPVIYAVVSIDPEVDIQPRPPLVAMALESKALIKGSAGVDIVEELLPVEGDVILEHQGTSAFVGGQLAEILSSRGIDTLVITGVATNVIVEGTARDAGNSGFNVFVLNDCVAAGDETSHTASLSTMAMLTNGVLASSEFLSALGHQTRLTGTSDRGA